MLVDIVIFLIVLGVLIFFHELGHFVAAKACGIYCERFSLGMPPRLIGVRLGETDYCLGALPFGGYVKMAGQEDVPMTDEEREETYGDVPPERWFNKRPVWQRMIVIVAGPMMNFVLAIMLYGIVAAVGAQVPLSDVDNRIGMIEPGSPADTAPLYRMAEGQAPDTSGTPDAEGWKPGDRIVTINGHQIDNISDVAIAALLGADSTLDVVVERSMPDDSVVRYLSPVKPAVLGDTGHARFGVGMFETALIDFVVPGSPAEAAGLKDGDIINRMDGEMCSAGTFSRRVEKAAPGEKLELEVLRGEERLTLTIEPAQEGRLQGVAISPPVDLREHKTDGDIPVVAHVTEEAEERLGLLRKDIIEQVNGEPATLARFRELQRANAGEAMTLTVKRPAILFGWLRPESVEEIEVAVDRVGVVGVQWGVQMTFHRAATAQVVPEAFRQAMEAVRRTLKTLAMLITGSLSPKDIGGPMMIYQVTTAAAREGYSWLLKITAFVSVNLFIFNLLPLPVLDGGMLVYLGIEGVRRKPLDMKVLERIQQVGLLLIIALMLFVTFNDISRWVQSLVP